MRSSIVIFNHPKPAQVQAGADFLSTTAEITEDSLRGRKVLVLNLESNEHDKVIQTLTSLKDRPQSLKIIAIGKNLSLDQIKSLSVVGSIYAWQREFSPDLDTLMEEATVHQTGPVLQEQLEALTVSEHQGLQHRSLELEDLVKKRERNLQRAQKRVSTINLQMEALLKSLQAVHTARSVGEVESVLLQTLEKDLNLSFVRVFFSENLPTQAQLERLPEVKTLQISLNIGSKNLGWMIFGRLSQKFTATEGEFLAQLAEGVSLAIDRLTKLEQAENLKQQWDSTFDSISEPLCLTDTNFKIIKTNKAFSEASGLQQAQLNSMNCFQAFVGKGSSPQIVGEGALVIEKVLKNSGEQRTYSVSAQKIQAKTNSLPILLVFFRDTTQQRLIEKQIFESAKMAELGTVGSSIAHELNNPLGGIISFLQLIKMDLKADDPLKADIIEMEKAGLRCKDIIENLLGFSRRQDNQSEREFDLREILTQSLRLIELKSRPVGVQIETKIPDHAVMVHGHPNLLAQAISHILQNSLESIEIKSEKSGRFKGEIRVSLRATATGAEILVENNGIGTDTDPLFPVKVTSNRGFGLSLAYKIVDEHKGRLEVFSRPNSGTEVRISLNNVQI